MRASARLLRSGYFLLLDLTNVKLLRHLSDLPAGLTGGAITIGNFDGVHRGHASIMKQLVQRAKEQNGPAVAFTFDPHPAALLRPGAMPPPLSWLQRKAQLLGELGVDALLAYPTDRALLQLSPREFFQQIVVDKLKARAVVEGPNFFFGRDRAGDVATLKTLCEAAEIKLDIVQPLEAGGAIISSSRIRQLIASGDVQQAATLLTRPYRVRGTVETGARRGRTLGFPTANIGGITLLQPAPGVYAATVHGVAEQNGGQGWPAAVNVGPAPTFGVEDSKVEAHLIDFDGDLYGKTLEVDFHHRLREILSFDNVQQLQQQLNADVAAAREYLSQQPG